MTDQRTQTDDIAPLVPRLQTDFGSEHAVQARRADGGLPAPTTEVPLVPDVS